MRAALGPVDQGRFRIPDQPSSSKKGKKPTHISEVDILALSGSLRAQSFNGRLVDVARQLAPADARIERYDYSDLPLYDGDVEAAAFPDAVRRFKDRIRKADAILIATPEYNFSVPGVLKNALDWASRPLGDSAWTGKLLAIIGGGGGQGTNRAQDHLRLIAHALDMQLVRRPEIFVANIWEEIGPDGGLNDPVAHKLIGELLHNLVALAKSNASALPIAA